MPTYDYQCGKCGFEFERQQRIIEDPIKTCPKCKSRKAKRLLFAPNFILKGGGWYADGYGSSEGGKKEPASSDTSDSPSSSSSETDSTKSETKSSSSKDADSKPKKSKGKPSGKSAA